MTKIKDIVDQAKEAIAKKKNATGYDKITLLLEAGKMIEAFELAFKDLSIKNLDEMRLLIAAVKENENPAVAEMMKQVVGLADGFKALQDLLVKQGQRSEQTSGEITKALQDKTVEIKNFPKPPAIPKLPDVIKAEIFKAVDANIVEPNQISFDRNSKGDVLAITSYYDDFTAFYEFRRNLRGDIITINRTIKPLR